MNKAPNRRYRRLTLELKLNKAKLTYNKIINTLAEVEADLDESEFNFLNKCSRQVYGNIHVLISSKLEWAGTHKISLFSITYAILFINKLKQKSKLVKPVIQPKMAKIDIKTGTSLIEIYEGNPEKLDNFLDSVALFVDLVDSANAESTPAAQAA